MLWESSMPTLKVGDKVRLTAEGKEYWLNRTRFNFTTGTITQIFRNALIADRSPHYYEIEWEGEGQYAVYDIDVELIEPEFNVQLASNSKDIDEMITLATKLAKLTGKEFRIITMCLLLLLVGACGDPGRIEHEPYWDAPGGKWEVKCHPQFDLVRAGDRLKCRFRHAQ